jgi:hypothetical protein
MELTEKIYDIAVKRDCIRVYHDIRSSSCIKQGISEESSYLSADYRMPIS